MENNQNKIPYKHCLNCGEELHGKYCHKCGQYTSEPVPKIKDFLIEYANHAFIWDSKLVPTLWKLITKPGFLTKEFIRGKFNSYEHPLKLNMFFLLLFITLFVFFNSGEKIGMRYYDFFNNSSTSAKMLYSFIQEDEKILSKLKESEKDTINLISDSYLIDLYSDLIEPIEYIVENEDGINNICLTLVPLELINMNVIVPDDMDFYRFSDEITLLDIKQDETEFTKIIIVGMYKILSNYFPLIILLTTPFLSISIRLLNRKNNTTKIWNYVFSLHYIAFVTVLILLDYIIAISSGIRMSPTIILTLATIYLTMASHEVFSNNSWVKSFFKAVMTNIVYIIICLAVLILIFIITIYIHMDELDALL